MKNKLLLLSAFVATICISLGCVATNVQSNIVSDFSLRLIVKNNDITVRLANNSDHEFISHGLFLSSAKGGAGYYLTISDRSGRQHFQCAMIEQEDPGLGKIPPHGYIEREIPLENIRRNYCLRPGMYIFQATFAVLRPSASPQIIAESTPVSVAVK